MHLGWFPETVQYAQKARSWFVALGDDDDDAVWSQPLKQRLSVNTFHMQHDVEQKHSIHRFPHAVPSLYQNLSHRRHDAWKACRPGNSFVINNMKFRYCRLNMCI